MKYQESRLQEKFDEAKQLLLKLQDLLSENEFNYINETIESHAIPTPKTLIKDHKKQLPDGTYPTRLVVPANNFAAGFANVGYRGIKKCFEKYNINYTKTTIIQASDVKQKLEKLNIKKDDVTITSIDAVAMYPSIQCHMVKKAILYFLSTSKKEVTEEDKSAINQCLKMIEFSMSSTFLTFIDKYYEYDGHVQVSDRGLTIGGYESAWLADLVMSFILDNTEHLFDDTIYNGCYRDDGICIFKGNKTKAELIEWRNLFQETANNLLKSENLQFTMEIWKIENEDEIKSESVKVVTEPHFPFLDMEMFWNSTDLNFRVHLKENQLLKYLNNGSAHTHACYKAIPQGVIGRLAKLTSHNDDTKDKKLNILYPEHAEALKKANLAPESYPTLEEALNINKKPPINDETTPTKKKKKKVWSRQTFFCAGYHKSFDIPIHAVIKKTTSKTWPF